MAIVSSHLLNSINGSHASGVKIKVNQITKNGLRKKIFQTLTDKNGRFSRELKLGKKDYNLEYEIIVNLQDYFRKKTNVSNIVINFKMNKPKKKYHIPMMISPNSYSVWWSK